MLFKALVILLLAGIVASLGYGLFCLNRDEAGSKRLLRALIVRISLSVLLFILILAAYFTGMIQPHGLLPR